MSNYMDYKMQQMIEDLNGEKEKYEKALKVCHDQLSMYEAEIKDLKRQNYQVRLTIEAIKSHNEDAKRTIHKLNDSLEFIRTITK